MFSANVRNELKLYGFKKRGNAYFRIYGDGVVQVIKYEKERGFSIDLSIGLHSMYAELLPQWFTSRGCVPRYSILNIIGQRWGPSLFCKDDLIAYIHAQEEILLQDALPWLNAIETQQQLVEGMCYLETSWGGKILWNDFQKIAPYLCCKDFNAAEHVITAILEQHALARRSNRSIFPREKYLEYIKKGKEEDAAFEHLLCLIQNKDHEKIQSYLASNYSKNIEHAWFCLPKQ